MFIPGPVRTTGTWQNLRALERHRDPNRSANIRHVSRRLLLAQSCRSTPWISMLGPMTDSRWVAIDVETANSYARSICALGVAHVGPHGTTTSRSWLVQPPGNRSTPSTAHFTDSLPTTRRRRLGSRRCGPRRGGSQRVLEAEGVEVICTSCGRHPTAATRAEPSPR